MPVGNFGEHALRNFAVTSDQKNLRIKLSTASDLELPEPPRRAPAIPPAN
jgi:hypothetical protein